MARELQYLIDIDTLKEISMIDNNIETGKLSVLVYRAQRRHLEPVLGTVLLEKLLNDVPNLTGDYKTLVDNYVIDYLAAAIEVDYLLWGNNKMTHAGTGHYTPDNTNINTTSENSQPLEDCRKTARTFRNKLVGHLQDNEDKFPEFKEYNCEKKEQIKADKGQTELTSFNVLTRKKYV